MDIILDLFDDYVGDRLYAYLFPLTLPTNLPSTRPTAMVANFISNYINLSSDTLTSNLSQSALEDALLVSRFARDNIFRQAASLYFIVYVGVFLLYFIIAGLSYYFIFDHRIMKHPKFLKNQVRQEIRASLNVFMPLDILTFPWFLFEVRGYSQLYDGFRNSPFGPTDLGSYGYLLFSSLLFFFFTDLAIYWIHRILHWPWVYKHLHKPHHKWIIPTPWASHAFHPLDGYAQSIPYHIFVYTIPLNKVWYMCLFVLVNIWSIFIHDSDMIVDHPLEHYVNGPAHHTLHHMYFTVNYGQYFTWADKRWNSYRHPAKEEDPLLAVMKKEGKTKSE